MRGPSLALLALAACGNSPSSAPSAAAKTAHDHAESEPAPVAPAPRDAPAAPIAKPASRAPCIAMPDPAPYSRWLDAVLADGILHACVIWLDAGNSFDEPHHAACVGIDPATGALSRVADEEPRPQPRPHGRIAERAGKPVACATDPTGDAVPRPAGTAVGGPTPGRPTGDAVPRPAGTAVGVPTPGALASSIDGTCRPVGKRLARALRSAPPSAVSADGTLVVTKTTGTGSEAVWNVARDRRLALRTPEVEPAYRDGDYDFLGDAVIGSWTPCAGPCTFERLYRADGKIVIPRIDTTEGVLALRGDQIAVLRGNESEAAGKLEIYSVHRAALVHSFTVVPPGLDRIEGQGGADRIPDPLLLLPDHRIAVIVGRKVADELAAVELAVVDSENGNVGRRASVPICAP